MKNQTFEEFLQRIFIDLREVGGVPIIKDNCEDMFDLWLSNMEGEDYMNWGELYGKSQFMAGKEEVLDKVLDGSDRDNKNEDNMIEREG